MEGGIFSILFVLGIVPISYSGDGKPILSPDDYVKVAEYLDKKD